MIFVILPVYNEEKVIGKLSKSLRKILQQNRLKHQIVIVNDGSTDDSLSKAKKLAKEKIIRVLDHGINKGLGEALKTGFKYVLERTGAKDIVITMDGDNTHPVDLIPEMVERINSRDDLVIASRYLSESKIHGLSKKREILSIIGSLLFFIVFPMKGVKDYTSGYRAYRADLLKKAFKFYGKNFINQSGFSCMVDILIKLNRFKPKISEIPLKLHYDLKVGKSKMNVRKTTTDTLILLIKRRFGYYL